MGSRILRLLGHQKREDRILQPKENTTARGTVSLFYEEMLDSTAMPALQVHKSCFWFYYSFATAFQTHQPVVTETHR